MPTDSENYYQMEASLHMSMLASPLRVPSIEEADLVYMPLYLETLMMFDRQNGSSHLFDSFVNEVRTGSCRWEHRAPHGHPTRACLCERSHALTARWYGGCQVAAL
jgi:hypothetical protein